MLLDFGYLTRAADDTDGATYDDHRDDHRDNDDRPVTVKAIHPKRDANFRVTNQQLASVEAYYEAGLRARASGIVKEVPRDIGEPVHAGDLLVVIDAYDIALGRK